MTDPKNIFPGDNSEEVTPVPIPNTDVKGLSGDGTVAVGHGRVARRRGFFCPRLAPFSSRAGRKQSFHDFLRYFSFQKCLNLPTAVLSNLSCLGAVHSIRMDSLDPILVTFRFLIRSVRCCFRTIP